MCTPFQSLFKFIKFWAYSIVTSSTERQEEPRNNPFVVTKGLCLVGAHLILSRQIQYLNFSKWEPNSNKWHL